ncbi:hypothetical protein [Bifidobacterium platyrrhinorum]|uniref:Collagen-like protein n=1 Tax=Bifidobacterium platyrrhinorum TaxID=2661628 RepID=A0A6L9SU52_9BIFI|nr:hypothetical protein [Bifidobacterium platyrrhinorum]NEG56137.1 hypothetical protein [Bifidobacterium platyrrhinorum]
MTDATMTATVTDTTADPTQYTTRLTLLDTDGNPIDLSKISGGAITSVKATALAAGTAPTATLAGGVLTLGIPAGATGPAGSPGAAGKNGSNGAAGVGVKAIALTTDTSGKVTAGTWTDTANAAHAITVTTAAAAGDQPMDQPSAIQ